MADWRQTTVGDVMTLQRGFDITKSQQNPGDVPVVSSGGISSFHDTAMVSSPGVVMGRKGTLGKVFYLDRDYWPHDTTLWVKDFKGNDPRFVYYFLGTLNFLGMDVGSSNPTLNRNHVHPVPIVWPSFSVQQSISGILGALDDKIAVNEHIAVTADALARAAFSARFQAGLDMVSRGRPLPGGWRAAALGEAAPTIESGRRPKGGVAGFSEGVPSVGAESISGLAKFDYSKTKFVPREFFVSLKKGVVRDRDILVYKDGGRPGEFNPKVTLFGSGFPYGELCINEHVYRVRMGAETSQAFGFYWLSSIPVMDEMRKLGTGVAIPGMNSTAFKSLPVAIPPASEIEAFGCQADVLIDRALIAANESKALASLRDTLLPQLMSGRLRVKDAEKIVEDHV
ncbi:restriction endonuclease subunit S [Streptomyces sp. b62]|uniref:restriction endonuclease subunit S n=1 Tax=Streptomyces sp. b62 TaxID=1827627 RepID=UPI000BF1E72F|nr:restriction endonuclease subunit S [Streptomyces sp. b62]